MVQTEDHEAEVEEQTQIPCGCDKRDPCSTTFLIPLSDARLLERDSRILISTKCPNIAPEGFIFVRTNQGQGALVYKPAGTRPKIDPRNILDLAAESRTHYDRYTDG